VRVGGDEFGQGVDRRGQLVLPDPLRGELPPGGEATAGEPGAFRLGVVAGQPGQRLAVEEAGGLDEGGLFVGSAAVRVGVPCRFEQFVQKLGVDFGVRGEPVPGWAAADHLAGHAGRAEGGAQPVQVDRDQIRLAGRRFAAPDGAQQVVRGARAAVQHQDGQHGLLPHRAERDRLVAVPGPHRPEHGEPQPLALFVAADDCPRLPAHPRG